MLCSTVRVAWYGAVDIFAHNNNAGFTDLSERFKLIDNVRREQ
jgi:hypothetical protein